MILGFVGKRIESSNNGSIQRKKIQGDKESPCLIEKTEVIHSIIREVQCSEKPNFVRQALI